VDYFHQCTECGAGITDTDAHDLWHSALADIWDWINRVSGDSCQTARTVLGDRP
jgi:hypothetical protein